MTVITMRETTEDVIAEQGVVYSDFGCQKIESGATVLDKCQFVIKEENGSFGLLIKDGFVPIWYDYEWVYLGNQEWMSYFFPW